MNTRDMFIREVLAFCGGKASNVGEVLAKVQEKFPETTRQHIYTQRSRVYTRRSTPTKGSVEIQDLLVIAGLVERIGKVKLKTIIDTMK